MLSELGAYRANNYPLWFGPLNNESANHQVISGLDKASRANVGQSGG